MLGRPLHDREPLGLPVDAEFFAQLSLAGRGRGFADIDVAAGDVPLITVSLAYQQQPVVADGIGILWVPETSSTSCDQVIFVDQTSDASLSSDAVLLKIGRFGKWLQRGSAVQ